MAYITASDVKTYLDITASGDDAFITTLISQAKAIIDRATKRNFEAATGTRYFDPLKDVRGGMLLLDADLASASGLVVTNGDAAVLASSGFSLVPANKPPYFGIQLKASANKTWTYATDPENAITVAGKWGWSTSAPADIQHATRRLVSFLYRQKGTNQDIDRPIIAPGGSVIMPHKLPADVQALLQPYVRYAG